MKSAAKSSTTRSPQKTGLVVGAVIVALLLVGYLVRGWIRSSVAPKTIWVVSGNSAKKTFDAELKKLGDPFTALGYPETAVSHQDCSLYAASKFRTTYTCTYEVGAFYEVSKDPTTVTATNSNAETIQKQLQANGWDGIYGTDSPYTSLEKLVKNINQGIDYTPDATYTKSVGDTTCMFSSNTAFASPKPAAISTHASCSREINLFGGAQLPDDNTPI